MNKVEVYELAALMCGYSIKEIKRNRPGTNIIAVYGSVKIRKRRTHNGKAYYTKISKDVRWNTHGWCFSIRSNVRLRNYDLPLTSALSEIKLKEEQACM